MQALLSIFKANQNLPGAPNWTDQQFLDECRSQATLTSVDQSGEVEAFILYRITPEAFEISYLATLPKAKRKGLMRDLLERLVRESKGKGLPIWLEVHERNSQAIALYENFGFVRTGLRPKYYADGASALLYNYG